MMVGWGWIYELLLDKVMCKLTRCYISCISSSMLAVGDCVVPVGVLDGDLYS